MPSTQSILGLILAYKYLIIVPLSLVAQPVVGMTSGFLARLGYLDPFVLYGVLLATALGGDVLLYIAGLRYGEGFASRFGKFIGITPEHVGQVQKIFGRHYRAILLISKLTNGAGLASVVLFTAGLSRVPFWRYLGLNFLGEAVWSALIIAIGYFLGNAYLAVPTVLGRVSFIAGAIVLLWCIVGFATYIRNRFVEKFEDES